MDLIVLVLFQLLRDLSEFLLLGSSSSEDDFPLEYNTHLDLEDNASSRGFNTGMYISF